MFDRVSNPQPCYRDNVGKIIEKAVKDPESQADVIAPIDKLNRRGHDAFTPIQDSLLQ